MLLSKILRLPSKPLASSTNGWRCFSITPLAAAQLPPRPVIPESDIKEAFLKGSGPGGQKINKTSSAVQLKHIPTGMVVKSQETRSRSQNRKIARRVLAEKLEVLEKGPESRIALKEGILRKKKARATKKSHRKYRALAQRDGDEAEAAGRSDSIDDGNDQGGEKGSNVEDRK